MSARKAETLIERLERFKRTWLSNPCAMQDFALLIEAALDQDKHDHADFELREWIDEEHASAKRLGL